MSRELITTWFDSVTGLPVADLAGTNKLVSNWFFAGASNPVAATAVWPATGTPVGVIGVEGTLDVAAGASVDATARAVEGDAIDLTTLSPVPVQPAGPAGRMPLYLVSPAEFLRFTYLRTSGGTGSSLTVRVQRMPQ